MAIPKATILIAGLGTRFLPLSKILPKELWPLVDKPVAQYVLEEAIASGVKEFIFVTRPGKNLSLNYFKDILKSKKISFSQVFQKKQLGDGHAVLQTRKLTGRKPLAVLFADDIWQGKTPALKQLIKVFNKYRKPVIALSRLPKEKVSSYGIVKVDKINKRVYKIRDIVEKPSLKQAPSNLAIVGKYIITPQVFKFLEKSPKAKNEIRLAAAFSQMIKKGEDVYGYELEGKWLECGSIPSYLKSNLYLIKKEI